MYYKNKKSHYVKTIYKVTTTTPTTTNLTTSSFLLVMIILSSVALISISAVSTIQSVNAKMNNTNMVGSMMSSNNSNNSSMSSGSMGSNMMAIPAKAPRLNITIAAPPVSPTMFKSMSSQIRIDLVNATITAEKWAGSNSHAVSSTIGMQNGLPVYSIWVIDSNSGLHQIIVDPQNGKVLLANQPMSMSGPFS